MWVGNKIEKTSNMIIEHVRDLKKLWGGACGNDFPRISTKYIHNELTIICYKLSCEKEWRIRIAMRSNSTVLSWEILYKQHFGSETSIISVNPPAFLFTSDLSPEVTTLSVESLNGMIPMLKKWLLSTSKGLCGAQHVRQPFLQQCQQHTEQHFCRCNSTRIPDIKSQEVLLK